MAKKFDEPVLSLSPSQFSELVSQGRKRSEPMSQVRAQLIKAYVGPLYARGNGVDSGDASQTLVNLLYNLVRTLQPAVVIEFPRHRVTTPYTQYRDQAALYGLALSQQDKALRIVDLYQCAFIESLFSFGVVKTGLTSSDDATVMRDEDGAAYVDPGQVYSDLVDSDAFLYPPDCARHLFADASYLGDVITLPRQKLLDADGYDHDEIAKLPRSTWSDKILGARGVTLNTANDPLDALDLVDIAEIWVPSLRATVTMSAEEGARFNDTYLKITDYKGYKTGPYSFLSISPPVPANPIPVPPLQILLGLHLAANRIAKKAYSQAARQKQVAVFPADSVEAANRMKNAVDGEGLVSTSP